MSNEPWLYDIWVNVDGAGNITDTYGNPSHVSVPPHITRYDVETGGFYKEYTMYDDSFFGIDDYTFKNIDKFIVKYGQLVLREEA